MLGSTAMPGVQKLAALFFVGYCLTPELLGRFVNDIFIVQIAAIFSASSWAGVLMVDIHKYRRGGLLFYARVQGYACLYCIPLSGILMLLYHFGWLQDVCGSILFLFAFTLYQIWRHYMLAFHRYAMIVCFDSVILAGSGLLAFVARYYPGAVLLLQALPYLLPVLSIRVFPSFRLGGRLHTRALQQGFANFSTSSMPLFIAPVAYKLLNPSYTAVIGIFTNIANVILLIPRSMAFHEIPALAKVYNDKIQLSKVFRRYQRSVNQVLMVLMMLALAAIVALYYWPGSIPFTELPFIYFIYGLMIVAALVSQLSLPLSNLLNISLQDGWVLWVNAYAFGLFVALFYTWYHWMADAVFVLIGYQVLLILVNLMRFGWLTRISRPVLRYNGVE